MHKLEIFTRTVHQTSPDCLLEALRGNSRDDAHFQTRRVNFIQSLAVMSVVGFVLGLGDRHPSNIMVDRETGGVVHIDFGECFDVAQMRERFPERVPFRLTRQLEAVIGDDPRFTETCNQVFECLRENQDRIIQVLESFLFDPLVDWKLRPDQLNLVFTKISIKLKQTNLSEIMKQSTEDYNLCQMYTGWCPFW